MPKLQAIDPSRSESLAARSLAITLGALYGLAVTGAAVMACGGGHGTYVILGIISAPLGFLGVWAAVVFAPLLWASFFFVASARAMHQRMMAAAALISHYLAAAVMLTRTEFGDWTYFRKYFGSSPETIVEPLAIYFAGQLFLWLIITCTALRLQRLITRNSVASAYIAIATAVVAVWSGLAVNLVFYMWYYATVVTHLD